MYNLQMPFTPKTVVEEQIELTIPVYQRLFVWGEEQIGKLLEDLFDSFQKNNQATYYIGAITIWKKPGEKNVWEIVDGQQRLTFLSLFFAVCTTLRAPTQESPWRQFNHPAGATSDLRIQFVGRPKDKEGIMALENGENFSNVNDNFSVFRAYLLAFFQKHSKDISQVGDDSQSRDAFIQYVYEHTAFLVVPLPDDYTAHDLNLYFEQLNSTGRQIGPVDEVRGMLQLNPDQLVVWNACMDFSKAYDSNTTTGNKETPAEKALSLKDFLLDPQRKPTGNPDTEDGRVEIKYERSILKPEVFLVHLLALIDKDTPAEAQGKRKHEFQVGDPGKVVSLFRTYINEDADCFKKTLLDSMPKYRKWLDHYIICLEGESGGKYSFRKIQDETSDEKEGRNMLVLQSFLYVSSNEKQGWVLDAFSQWPDGFSVKDLEEVLDKQDSSKRLDSSQLSYQAHNRYWFFKLDYLLWKTRHNWLRENDSKWKSAVEEFVFQGNRSIEHLHPQNPAVEIWANLGLDAETLKNIKDCFGNLALISSSTNSFFSNATVNEKFARLEGRLAQGLGLESLKLLRMGMAADFQEGQWTPKLVKQHGEAMLNLLKYHSECAPAGIADNGGQSQS